MIGVFKNFEKEGEFLCFAGQSTQAVTGMFNLYRASQVLFPGEKILEDANQFSAKYLTHKRAANQLLDKWIMTKDLPGEVCIYSTHFINFMSFFLYTWLICVPKGGLRIGRAMVCELTQIGDKILH